MPSAFPRSLPSPLSTIYADPLLVAIDDWFDITINTTSTTAAVMSVPPSQAPPLIVPSLFSS
jgi:hypothetical protein